MRLRCAGICNTDLELLRGYYHFQGIPGHEFVADVVSADNPKLIGQRVVGEINITCHKCKFCRGGLGRHCQERKVLGIKGHPGAFAEYLTLPVENLHPIPQEVTDEHATFIEPLAAACAILEQVAVCGGQQVAVLGEGKLGSLVVQVLRHAGADVSAIHRNTVMAPDTQFRLTVDCTGSPAGLERAIRMTEPRGTVIMKTTSASPTTVNTAAAVVNEISLVGSRCGLFAPALELLTSAAISVDHLISAKFELKAAPEALEYAGLPGARKVLLTPAKA